MIYDRPPQPPYCAESEAIMAMRRGKHQRVCVLLDKAGKVEDSVLRKRVQDGNVIFKKLLLDSSADNGDYIAECSWDLDGLSEEFRDLTSAKAQHAYSFLSDTMDTSNDQTQKPDENDKPTENGETASKFKSIHPECGVKGGFPESAPVVESKPDPSMKGDSPAPTTLPSDSAPTEKAISEAPQVNAQADLKNGQRAGSRRHGEEGRGKSRNPKRRFPASRRRFWRFVRRKDSKPNHRKRKLQLWRRALCRNSYPNVLFAVRCR
eukprot:99954_1